MKTQIKELALVVSQGKLDEPLWPFWDKKVGSPQFLILEKLLSQESLTEDPGPSAGPGYIPFDALDSKKTLHKLRSNLINSLFFPEKSSFQ